MAAPITILGGIAMWFLGRAGGHIGASGLVFGLFGFLISRAIFELSPRAVWVALIVFVSHGTMIYGVLPQNEGISWEGHLFGLIAGVVVAYFANAVSVRGEDVRGRLDITLEQAFSGDRCRHRVPTPSTTSARPTRWREFRVCVPPGVTDGQTLILQGAGGECAGTGPPGNLLLDVQFTPHPIYGVEGRDITSSLSIAPEDAAQGARVGVPTLKGDVTLTVPAGSATGDRLRLRGRGLPGRLPGEPPGHHFVTLEVDPRSHRA